MGIRFRWLGSVCYEIILPSGKVLIIDPYINYSPTAPIECEEVTGADYIVLTHGHSDHCSDLGYLAKKFGSTIICSQKLVGPLAKFFDLNVDKFIGVIEEQDIVVDDLKIEVKKANHVNLEALVTEANAAFQALTGKSAQEMAFFEVLRILGGFSPRPDRSIAFDKMRKKMLAAGIEEGDTFNYIFQTSDNLRFYIYSAGYSENMRRQVADASPNISFIQLSGVEPYQAAEIAALSGAEIVIPTHHDNKWLGKMHQRAQEMGKHLESLSKAKFLDIELGKWYEIEVNVRES